MIEKCGLNFLQILSTSSWRSHSELLDISRSKFYIRNAAARFENVTKEQLLEMGFPVVKIEALQEALSETRNAFEAWKWLIETAIMKLNRTERMKLGHNASIFLHTATFPGKCSCTVKHLETFRREIT